MRFQILLLVVSSFCAFGVDFHVAKTGNDSNVGSLASPFLTIQKAADAIATHIATNGSPQTNYTAHIHVGIYTNQLAACISAVCDFVTISSSGTVSNPIVFTGYSNEVATLWGFGFSDLDTTPADGLADGPNQPTKVESLIKVLGNYVHIKKLTFENCQDSALLVDGSNCLVEDVVSRNNWGGGIIIGSVIQGLCDSNTVRYCETHHNRHYSGILVQRRSSATNLVTHTLIENCLSYRNGFDANNIQVLPIGGDPEGGGNADGFTVGKECADATASTNFSNHNLCPSNVVRGVVSFLNADDGFDSSWDSSLFENNLAFANGPAGQMGFKMLRNQTNATYVGNVVYANGDRGFDLRVDGLLTLYHNVALGNVNQGFQGVSGLVKNNVGAFNGGNDLSGTSSANATNNWVEDGVGTLDNPSRSGNPLITSTNLFAPAGVVPSYANIVVNFPASLGSIRAKLDWIKWHFRQAFQPQTSSGLVDAGATGVTYDDPITGLAISRSFTGAGPDIGAFESIPRELPLQDHTRVVFVGDSITDAQRWTHYVSAYLALMFPQFTLHTQTEGRGGTNLRELYTTDNSGPRYDKNVYAYQSQASNMIVFLMYGRNNSGVTNVFYDDMLFVSTNRIQSSNSALPVLVSPHPENQVAQGTIFSEYEDIATYIASANGGWPNARIYRALTNVWVNNTIDGADVTHPGAGGHTMIAYQVIKQLGLETNVSSAVINGSAPSITSTNHCVISSLSTITDGISFVRLDDRLPWAFDEAGRAMAESFMPEMVGWQNYTITVTGLAAGTYNISVDGSLVETATHTALAAGLNMSTWNQGPIHSQLQEVLGRIRDCHWIDRTTLAQRPNPAQGVAKYRSNAANGYNNLGYRGQDLIDYLQTAISQITAFDALIHTAAQPVARTFTIVNQSPGGGGAVSIVGRKPRGLLFTQ